MKWMWKAAAGPGSRSRSMAAAFHICLIGISYDFNMFTHLFHMVFYFFAHVLPMIWAYDFHIYFTWFSHFPSHHVHMIFTFFIILNIWLTLGAVALLRNVVFVSGCLVCLGMWARSWIYISFSLWARGRWLAVRLARPAKNCLARLCWGFKFQHCKA